MATPNDNYIISRNANEAARLDVQHQCILSCQGYYLHPSIPCPPAGAQIADLCTGTAIWLREVASANPGVECHGFDISDTMFPSQELLPPDVHLHLADVKEPFESRWLGYFDIVHLRLIQAAMRTEEWGFVLRNITTLLKPGGWLQWVEGDTSVSVRHACRPAAPPGTAKQSLAKTETKGRWRPPQIVHIDRFNRQLMPDDRVAAMNYGYMNLDVLFADPNVGNLEEIDSDTYALDRAVSDDGGKLRKQFAIMGIGAAWNMLEAREDLRAEIAHISRDQWANKAEGEIDLGAHYPCRCIVVIGRKK